MTNRTNWDTEGASGGGGKGMPRHARLDSPGTLRHVMVRGIEKRRIVDDATDRRDFVRRLGALAEETRTPIYAWALMSNHVHMLLCNRAEWPPGDHAPFLGSERFVRKMVKEKAPPPVSRRVSLSHLLGRIASAARLEPQSLKRKGRTARMVEARDRFICQAVWEEGCLASELASFLGCHPSNVSRALQKGLAN